MVRLRQDHQGRQGQDLRRNAVRLYKIDLKAKRNALPADGLEKLKVSYLENGGQRINGAYGWVHEGD